AAAAVVRGLAEALVPMHRLDPPLVHRRLRPGCVLVRRSDDGELVSKIAGLGVDDLAPARVGDAGPYRSPEQLRGEDPDPRDAVYALGVLWYQLLTGDLKGGRPGGSHWRQTLAARGMAAPLIDLLESCFEDDPSHRPANALGLSARLAELLTPVKE